MKKIAIPIIRQREVINFIKRIPPPIPKIQKVEIKKAAPKPVDKDKQQLILHRQQQIQVQLQHARIVKNSNLRPVVKTNIHTAQSKDLNYHKIMNIKNSGNGMNLVMIACGPSANEVDFSKLKGNNKIRIMIINKPIDYIWPVDYWAFCDNSQYIRNRQHFESYNGLLINSIGVKARSHNQLLIKAIHGKGFSYDITNGYYIGRSSVFANMQVALYMNFSNIFIFGIDMCAVNGKTHHYGDGFNPDVDTELRIKRFDYEAEHYLNAGNTLPEAIRKRFYFCSSYNKYPFVDRFNKMDHATAVDKILEMSK